MIKSIFSKKNWVRFLLLVLLLSFSTQLVSMESQTSHFITFSLVHPISTNSSKLDSTNINLALFQNSLGEVDGVSLCGFSAISKRSVDGLQASLIYSQIDDNLRGVSFSTVNVVNDNVQGIQLGIFASLLGKSFTGWQVANIVNFVGGTFTGYQQSAVYNIVGKDFRGLQTAGAGNVVGGNFKGVQFGTTFNFIGNS